MASPQNGNWIRITAATRLVDSPRSSNEIAQVKKKDVFEILRKEGDWLLLDIPFSNDAGWVTAKKTTTY